MRRNPAPVLGVDAPPPRPTFAGAFWLASALSIPVGVILITIEGAVRMLF